MCQATTPAALFSQANQQLAQSNKQVALLQAQLNTKSQAVVELETQAAQWAETVMYCIDKLPVLVECGNSSRPTHKVWRGGAQLNCVDVKLQLHREILTKGARCNASLPYLLYVSCYRT